MFTYKIVTKLVWGYHHNKVKYNTGKADKQQKDISTFGYCLTDQIKYTRIDWILQMFASHQTCELVVKRF